MKKKLISQKDLLLPPDFAAKRPSLCQQIIDLKRHRRVQVGAEATLHFENYDTLLWQIQEMLHIEKGGEEQIEDELLAYNPLIPQGKELVATLMIEIDDPIRRLQRLSELTNIENYWCIRFSNHAIKGVAEEDPNRTTESGKTSAVHFIRWPFTTAQITDFSKEKADVVVEVMHPHLSHKILISEESRQSLAADFDND